MNPSAFARLPFVARLLFTAILGCIVALPAAGADRFWIGNGFNDNWSLEGNWSPDGDTLIFATAALPGDVIVTVKNGAQWTMNVTNRETVRELIGDGRVFLGAGATLTVDAENSHEFSGVLSGSGALDKRGPGELLLSGASPDYTGPTTVFFGSVRVDGRLPSSPFTVKSGAGLFGDGAVGHVTAIEQDSIVRVDSSFADHPERASGDLAVSDLTLGPGAILAFEAFGPAPTGGNDLLIAHGAVNLNTARLSLQFGYPPREGDVLTLIRKDSAGAINGVFSGLPEGATRKRGDVTVRASYAGGDGNDFTLTVTNLALSHAGGPVFSGNGNATVETDECLLTHVFVRNRRDVPLTITNAFLRSLTPEVLVTVAHATYPAVPASNVMFNTEPFQFRTTPAFHCGTPISFELEVGVAGEGVFAIPFTVPGSTNCAQSGSGTCESCFVVNGRFTTNAPALLRPHNFIGGPSLCFPLKRCPETNLFTDNVAVPCLAHSFTNSTTNELCVTAQLKFGCPGSPTNALGAIAYLGTNDYHGPCVNYLGDTGADGTQPFSFRVPPLTNFLILVSARATNVLCAEYALELFGLPCPPPTLRIAKDRVPGRVLLQWSTAHPDYRLQAAPSLRSPGLNSFTNSTDTRVVVSGRYTITNATHLPQQFHRLSK